MDIDFDSEQPVKKTLTLFTSEESKIAVVPLTVFENDLNLKTSRSLSYSIIQEISTGFVTQMSYLERNKTAKKMDLTIQGSNSEKQITLILYRSETSSNARILEQESQVVLDIEYSAEEPVTPPEDPESPADDGNEGKDNENASIKSETEASNPPNNDTEGDIEDPESEDGDMNSNETGTQLNNDFDDQVPNENNENKKNSFNYMTLGIVLGGIAFVVVIASVVGCVVNQNRKNRILKEKLKNYKKQNTVLRKSKQRVSIMNASKRTSSTQVDK